jgi:uncharacterized protein YqhQ
MKKKVIKISSKTISTDFLLFSIKAALYSSLKSKDTSKSCQKCPSCFLSNVSKLIVFIVSFVFVLLIFLLPVLPMFILTQIPASFIGIAELIYYIEFTPRTVNIT